MDLATAYQRVRNALPLAHGNGAANSNDGTVVVAGNLKIDGPYEGVLDGLKITVLEGASVHGELGAEKVVIHGFVRGVVRAFSIAIRSTARVEGELFYEKLSVSPGARVDARCIPS